MLDHNGNLFSANRTKTNGIKSARPNYFVTYCTLLYNQISSQSIRLMFACTLYNFKSSFPSRSSCCYMLLCLRVCLCALRRRKLLHILPEIKQHFPRLLARILFILFLTCKTGRQKMFSTFIIVILASKS